MDIDCHVRQTRVQLLICNPPTEWIFGWYQRLCQPLVEFITHVTSLGTPSPPHLGTHRQTEGIFLCNVSRDPIYTYLFTYLIALDLHGRRGYVLRRAKVLVVFVKDAPSDFDGLVFPILRPLVGLEVPDLKARMKNYIQDLVTTERHRKQKITN